MTPHEEAKRELQRLEPVAGNGLLHRRAFLRGGATLAGAMSAYRLVPSASAQKLADDPWSLAPGAAVRTTVSGHDLKTRWYVRSATPRPRRELNMPALRTICSTEHLRRMLCTL